MLSDKQLIFLGVATILLFVYVVIIKIINQDSESRKALLQPRKRMYMDGPLSKELTPLV